MRCSDRAAPCSWRCIRVSPCSSCPRPGIAAATSGLARAHVIRLLPPFRADVVSIPHYHDVEFQLVYVLKGWLVTDFEGQGPVTMRQGSCWVQPPRIKHAVLDYSDDCELLEVILPADFDTVELAKPQV